MTICLLNPGDLFTCDLGTHEGRLYYFERTVLRGDNVEYCQAHQIMERVDGQWFTCTGRTENWNPYCDVTKVEIRVVPRT